MIRFVKAHACGNDFLIVDEPLDASRYADMARIVCARNTGVGADGVEYLTLAGNGAYSIRLFNADGSEAEISGNGTRCVAAYLAQEDDANEFSIRTHAGVRRCRILRRNPPQYLISTEMGVPSVTAQTVMLEDGTSVAGVNVSIGNPHFVVFVDSPNFGCFGRSWQQIGSEVCVHPDFPKGTNVEFVRVMDTNRIEFRIYERGVGPTLSSGTGSSASAAASIEMRGVARQLTVVAEGGEQTVEWMRKSSNLLLTGPAEIIAQGNCLLV
ncbi:MAG TPA: diaminopimelate epimerase [Acidobacteriaceae bacterium]|nr:diaminopimelate epimerase [Acidobacteriaceae bacterium]